MINNQANKPCVYLVEDDQDDQYMFKMIVKELDIDVELHIFDNCLAVYEALMSQLNIQEADQRKMLPDLLLLDMNLPIWDGKKTLRRIKNQEDLKVVPVVIYTTSKSDHDKQECYALGANSFISKEAEYDQLNLQIERIFNYWFKT